jgi:predicted glycosyltransferase
MSVKDDIAKAIQQADKSYFFENYTKQAEAVIRELHRNGYVITPRIATDEMIAEGEKAILPGKVKPADHLRWVYEAMIKAGVKSRPKPK